MYLSSSRCAFRLRSRFWRICTTRSGEAYKPTISGCLRHSIPGDNGYRPDLSSSARLTTLRPFLAGGRIFDEKSTKSAEVTAKRYLGKGPEARQGRTERTLKLGQFLALASALPLGFLLWRNRG